MLQCMYELPTAATADCTDTLPTLAHTSLIAVTSHSTLIYQI